MLSLSIFDITAYLNCLLGSLTLAELFASYLTSAQLSSNLTLD